MHVGIKTIYDLLKNSADKHPERQDSLASYGLR